MGTRLFCVLSDCEDKGVLPGIARWAKISLLGVFIALTASMASESSSDVVDCYVIVEMPTVSILAAKAEPNPTAGADSVTVSAQAEVIPHVSPEGTVITGADITIDSDTTRSPMIAVDGTLDESLEKLKARIPVTHLEPGTTWVYVNIETSQNVRESEGIRLVITEGEAIEADSTGSETDSTGSETDSSGTEADGASDAD